VVFDSRNVQISFSGRVSPITGLSILLFIYFYHRFASLVVLCFQAVVACLYLVPVANALRGIARATTCYGTRDELLVGILICGNMSDFLGDLLVSNVEW